MKIDIDFMNMLGEKGIPFGIVFTKTDKQSARQTAQNVEVYKKTLSQWWEELPPVFLTSAEKRAGGDEILGFIDLCLAAKL